MDFNTLALSMGSAWLSGINLYATVLTLGLLQRYHLVQLPGSLNHLSNWWVIGAAGFLYVIQFFADKIPAVDSFSDALHTFIQENGESYLFTVARKSRATSSMGRWFTVTSKFSLRISSPVSFPDSSSITRRRGSVSTSDRTTKHAS